MRNGSESSKKIDTRKKYIELPNAISRTWYDDADGEFYIRNSTEGNGRGRSRQGSRRGSRSHDGKSKGSPCDGRNKFTASGRKITHPINLAAENVENYNPDYPENFVNNKGPLEGDFIQPITENALQQEIFKQLPEGPVIFKDNEENPLLDNNTPEDSSNSMTPGTLIERHKLKIPKRNELIENANNTIMSATVIKLIDTTRFAVAFTDGSLGFYNLENFS